MFKSAMALRVFAVFLLAGLSSPVYSIDIIDYLSNCNSVNCNSQLLRGTIQSSDNLLGRNRSWSTTAFCGAGECCRFAITRSDTGKSLNLSVVGPGSELHYRSLNDPPVVALEAPRSGEYTVIVGTFLEQTGSAPTSFSLRYGRYPHDNLNCETKSLPMVDQEEIVR